MLFLLPYLYYNHNGVFLFTKQINNKSMASFVKELALAVTDCDCARKQVYPNVINS
jgi:hypothetical protein